MLKSFYVIGVSSVFVYMLVLNLLQCILWTLYDRGVSSVSITHAGMFHSSEYQFLPYLWIDLMVGLILFGGAFLSTA